MAMWIQFKAKPNERKNSAKSAHGQTWQAKICRICGRPITKGGDICLNCLKFIKSKRQEDSLHRKEK